MEVGARRVALRKMGASTVLEQGELTQKGPVAIGLMCGWNEGSHGGLWGGWEFGF